MVELYVVCNCPKKDCARHGNCAACRLYHLRAKGQRLPYCERRPGWFRRMVQRALDKRSAAQSEG